MSWLRNILSALILTASSLAFAQSPATEQLQFEEQDLADYMTPAELMRELGVDANGILWKASAADPTVKLIVDKAERGTSQTAQTLEIYIEGRLFKTVKVSTGKEVYVTTPTGTRYFATTPTGEYKIYSRNRYHKSKKWDGASMNYAQFFNGGIAFHATTESHYKELGSRDSGGCVRLRETDAEMLWELVNKATVVETKVIIYDSTEKNHPLLPKISYDYDEPNQRPFGRADQYDQQTQYEQHRPLPTPTPRPKATPKPAPKATPKPRVEAPMQNQYAPPQDNYAPHGQYVPQNRRTDPYAQQQYAPPPPQAAYPTNWTPSANPTPPPVPPRGMQDTYPYCYAGYWCPRPVRR